MANVTAGNEMVLNGSSIFQDGRSGNKKRSCAASADSTTNGSVWAGLTGLEKTSGIGYRGEGSNAASNN